MLDQSLNSHWERTDRDASAMRSLTASNKRVPLACKVYKVCLNNLLRHRLDGSNKKQKGPSFWSSYLHEQLRQTMCRCMRCSTTQLRTQTNQWWRLTLKHLCITILLQCLSQYCCNKYIIWQRSLYKMFSFRDKYKLNVWLLMWGRISLLFFFSFLFFSAKLKASPDRQRTTLTSLNTSRGSHTKLLILTSTLTAVHQANTKKEFWTAFGCLNQKRHTETELSILFKCI